MSGASALRKELGSRLRDALSERGFRRLRKKDLFRSEALVRAPLEARLVVGVDTDRWDVVRMGGTAKIVCGPVDEAYGTAPDEALTRLQQAYRGRMENALASATFGRLSGRSGVEPSEWRAAEEEQGDRALTGLLAFVDGPVQQWIAEHADLPEIRAAVDSGPSARDGILVRNVSVLDAVLGDPERGLARLHSYLDAPEEEIDSEERVEQFIAWLRTVEPRPDLPAIDVPSDG